MFPDPVWFHLYVTINYVGLCELRIITWSRLQRNGINYWNNSIENISVQLVSINPPTPTSIFFSPLSPSLSSEIIHQRDWDYESKWIVKSSCCDLTYLSWSWFKWIWTVPEWMMKDHCVCNTVPEKMCTAHQSEMSLLPREGVLSNNPD